MRFVATIWVAFPLILFYIGALFRTQSEIQAEDVPLGIAMHFALILSLLTFRVSFGWGGLLMLIAAALLLATGFYAIFNTNLQEADIDFAPPLLLAPVCIAMPFGIATFVLWLTAYIYREQQDVTQQ